MASARPLLWGRVTRTPPRRPALAVLLCTLVLLPALAAAPAASAAQERRPTTTTTLLEGDRPTNYAGLGAIVLGVTAWAVVFGVVLYRSPRRASTLRATASGGDPSQ